MFLTMINLVEPEAFLVELNSLIFVLMLLMNAQALTLYCRNAGNPYINNVFKKKVRKYKIIIVVWNFAFILKFFLSIFGTTVLELDEQSDKEDNFWFSVETFINIMFTEIVPFYFVLDKKFVKIFTLKFLDNDAEVAQEIGSADGASNLNESVNLDIDDERRQGIADGSPLLNEQGHTPEKNTVVSAFAINDEVASTQLLRRACLTVNASTNFSDAMIQ